MIMQLYKALFESKFYNNTKHLQRQSILKTKKSTL